MLILGEELIIINEQEVLPIIIISTNATEEQEKSYYDKVNQYVTGIVVLKDKIVYKNQLLANGMEYKYSDIASTYGVTEFNKQDVLDFINNIDTVNIYVTFFMVIVIYMFIVYFTSTLLDVLAIAILGFLFARVVRMKIKFSACFNMAVHSLTLPIILNAIYIVVNVFTGFEIKYFQWMYATISYIYIIIAILMIKTDLINRQIELQKIYEEQEKVKKELEEQRRKEEEEKKQENKEPKEEKKPEEKKKDKKKDGVGDSGLAPQQ